MNDLKLNLKQIEAITRKDGIYRVISGAGTGKTLVLAYRIAHLIRNGVKPGNILALTFTREAAREMKERIQSATGCNGNLSVSTFHSFCYRMLKTHNPKFNCKIVDDEERLRTLKKACGDDISEDDATETFRKIDAYKEICVSPQEMKTLDREFYPKYQGYESKKAELGLMDYADLIHQAWELLKNNQQLLRQYRARYYYINIDEFQDTSSGQFKIVKLLMPPQDNLFVVGDDSQSIFSFRCAHPEYIIEFEKMFPNCQTIILEENYRSTRKLLDASNSLIRNNINQVPKVLYPNDGDGCDINVLEARDEGHEAEVVSKEIEKLTANGINDIAILYRTNWWGEAFRGLTKEGIVAKTIHKVKGREYDTVFIVGMIEGIIPHEKGLDIEEERRLAYVAMTRAKERLYLCYPATYKGHKATQSRFITEALGGKTIDISPPANNKSANHKTKDKIPKNGQARLPGGSGQATSAHKAADTVLKIVKVSIICMVAGFVGLLILHALIFNL